MPKNQWLRIIGLTKTSLIALLFIGLVQTSWAARLDFPSLYNFSDYTGQTYLNFMEETVKPALDKLAIEGYTIRGSEAVEDTYNLVDTKIKRKMKSKWGGLDNVKMIADELEGKKLTMHTLPHAIGDIDDEDINVKIDKYGLATFLGLASGGGVAIRYYKGNYGYNVHYDVKEERSGRSFGVGPTRKANDASDKAYLDDLEAYVMDKSDNTKEFYTTLFASLLNCDPSNYRNVEDHGQTVLTDFLSVFTAEQVRNLMDGRVKPHWDAALLEVTLLAAFHAGQDDIKLFYRNPETKKTVFTNTTLKQTPCKYPEREQEAGLSDYWQFSRNINSKEHCRRSGINITKREFRKLGSEITSYLVDKDKNLFSRLKKSIDRKYKTTNIFQSLSYYLIDSKLPEELDANTATEVTEVWVEFLELIRNDANEITSLIEKESL